METDEEIGTHVVGRSPRKQTDRKRLMGMKEHMGSQRVRLYVRYFPHLPLLTSYCTLLFVPRQVLQPGSSFPV